MFSFSVCGEWGGQNLMCSDVFPSKAKSYNSYYACLIRSSIVQCAQLATINHDSQLSMRRLMILTSVLLFELCLGHINTITTPFLFCCCFFPRHRGHVTKSLHGFVVDYLPTICSSIECLLSFYGEATSIEDIHKFESLPHSMV